MMGFGHGMFGRGFLNGFGIMGGGLFSMIFWLIIIAAAFYFFTNYNRDNHQRSSSRNFNNLPQSSRAEEIAKERFAKGEISKDELKEILDNIK